MNYLDRIAASFRPQSTWSPQPEQQPEQPEGVPLFELSREVIEAIDPADRGWMLQDMLDCDVLHLPFPKIALRFYLPAVLGALLRDPEVRAHGRAHVTVELGGDPYLIQSLSNEEIQDRGLVAVTDFVLPRFFLEYDYGEDHTWVLDPYSHKADGSYYGRWLDGLEHPPEMRRALSTMLLIATSEALSHPATLASTW